MNKRPKLNQRGVALFSTIVAIFLFLGMAVVAIDVGHLAHTATEVQTAAEVAATSGAIKLINEIMPIESGGGGNTCAGAAPHVTNEAYTVVDENRVAGIDVSTFPRENIAIEVGVWNDVTGFQSDETACNAVKATVTVNDVPNIVAGIFGDYTSTVTKSAVAGVGSLGVAGPDLPLTVGACCGCDNAPCTTDLGGDSGTCLPTTASGEFDCSSPVTIEIPNNNANSGWTDWMPLGVDANGDDESGESLNDCLDYSSKDPDRPCTMNPSTGKLCCGVLQFFPTEWCAQNAETRAGCPEFHQAPDDFGGCGLGAENPEICTVSTCSTREEGLYNLQESQGSAKVSPWVIADGVLQGNNDFTVPVVGCDGKRPGKSAFIAGGFANIHIDEEQLATDICNKDWGTKRFTVTVSCAAEPGPVGGGAGTLPTGPVVLKQ